MVEKDKQIKKLMKLKMLRKISFITAAFCLNACISVETPDHLVADTVEVGKDVYYSIKEKVSGKESHETKTFIHEYYIPKDELVEQSNAKCIELVIDSARKSLNIYNLEIQKSTTQPKELDGQLLIECSILVTVPK